MNRDYANKCEADDFELFKDFNEKKFKLNKLGRTPSKHSSDASGMTEDGRYINIELKKRYNDINEYDTLQIETHKAYDLLNDYVMENKIPLYVNFLQDGHVVVFNLTKLKYKPHKKRVRTWSKLYQDYENEYKLLLDLKNAFIYKKTNDKYTLIQKGW